MNGSIFTTIVPIRRVVAPGVRIGWSIDRLSYAVDVGLQRAWMETRYRYSPGEVYCGEKDSFGFWSGSIGGRYFFSKQNVSPYVGGGIAAMSAKYKTSIQFTGNFIEDLFIQCADTGEYTEENSGLGTYGVIGIEVRGYTIGHMNLELRIDRPFFKLPSQDVMPIILGITGGFSF